MSAHGRPLVVVGETGTNPVKVALWLSRPLCVSGAAGGPDRSPSPADGQEVRRQIPGQNTHRITVSQSDRQAGIDVSLTGCCACCCRRTWWTRWRTRRAGRSSWTAGWSQVSRAPRPLHLGVISAAASSCNLLSTGGAAVPGRSLEVAALACRCLDRVRKRRPAMTEVRHTVRCSS